MWTWSREPNSTFRNASCARPNAGQRRRHPGSSGPGACQIARRPRPGQSGPPPAGYGVETLAAAPHLDDSDRGFWVALRRSWVAWAGRLVIVTPETVVRWQQQRFRRYWTRTSHEHRRTGRPRINPEVRKLIRGMALENGWGSPRIHGELTKLGYDVSEATVSRYVPRRPPAPDKVQRWMTFLRNHKDAIAAMDFLGVGDPAATRGVPLRHGVPAPDLRS